MRLWPGEIFSIENDRTPEENMSRLKAYTKPFKFSLNSAENDPKNKPFWGKLKNGTFMIFPYVLYPNPFLLTITGTCAPTERGSDIYITISITHGQKVFFGIYLAILIVFETAMLIAAFSGQLLTDCYILAVPVMMAAFIISLPHIFIK